MSRSRRATRGVRFGAGITALAIAGACSGVALAGPPYTVHLVVKPVTTPIPGTFHVAASGLSSNRSRLRVFLNAAAPCAPTAAADAALAGDILVINPAGGVLHAYVKLKALTTVHGSTGPRGGGNHEACAYLSSVPPGAMLRATATAPYSIG